MKNIAVIKNYLIISILILLISSCDLNSQVHSYNNEPYISTQDVNIFVEILNKQDSIDLQCSAFNAYFDGGSAGLKEYNKKFKVNPPELCNAVKRNRKLYNSIHEQLPRIDSLYIKNKAVLNRLSALHPNLTWPPVYFVVGNGIAGGTVVKGRKPMVLIGAEKLQETENLMHLIAHESFHIHQDHSGIRMLTGGPKFLRATVLRLSIIEGAADFLADLLFDNPITSKADRYKYGEANEKKLWLSFKEDMLEREHSMWIYNGWNKQRLKERPADMGYYIGYKIVQAYYNQADDKKAAIKEILTINDFEQFLIKSRYDEKFE